MAKRSKIAQAAYEIAEPVAKELGYDLVDAEYKKEGQDMFLRLYIDKKGGLGINDCEIFSQTIDPILDEKLKHDADYFEVSSPGLTRPLSDEADYKRYEGEKLDVSLFKEVEGVKAFTAEIKESDSESVSLMLEDERVIKVNYADISKAVRHIDWNKCK